MSPDAGAGIEARGLAKRYGKRLAVAGVDLAAGPGEIVGLIGPNGAGKTTTIKLLATLVAPDAGGARIAGLDVVADAAQVRARIGYMPERFGLYDELTVEQYLDFFARVHGLVGRARTARIEAVLELTDLRGKRHDACQGLSKGVRQRVFLAKTLLHDPPVLLLDEPASGLDPQARIDLRALLQVLRDQGRTVLISSHILSELDRVCTAVAVIEGGRVRYAGPAGDVALGLAGELRIRIRLLDAAAAARALEVVAGDPRVVGPRLDGAQLDLRLRASREEVPALHRLLVSHELPVYTFEVAAPDLESLFLDVTRGLVT